MRGRCGLGALWGTRGGHGAGGCGFLDATGGWPVFKRAESPSSMTPAPLYPPYPSTPITSMPATPITSITAPPISIYSYHLHHPSNLITKGRAADLHARFRHAERRSHVPLQRRGARGAHRARGLGLGRTRCGGEDREHRARLRTEQQRDCHGLPRRVQRRRAAARLGSGRRERRGVGRRERKREQRVLPVLRTKARLRPPPLPY